MRALSNLSTFKTFEQLIKKYGKLVSLSTLFDTVDFDHLDFFKDQKELDLYMEDLYS